MASHLLTHCPYSFLTFFIVEPPTPNSTDRDTRPLNSPTLAIRVDGACSLTDHGYGNDSEEDELNDSEEDSEEANENGDEEVVEEEQDD
jgi:hypothetical protein